MTRKKIIVHESQGRLPFSGRGRGGVMAAGGPLERLVLVGAVFGFVLSSVLYMYFVMASVGHVAARGSLERDIALLSGEVAKLESQYLARSQDITEAYARSRGYVTAEKSAYVERASLVTFTEAR